MSDFNFEELKLAQDQLERGQVLEAIETLASLLGEDPDDAQAHALLSICLVRRKRLHAAGLEAASALQLAPETAFPHIAAASVASASRRFEEAKQHLLTAASIDGDSALVERELARLHLYWGHVAEARQHAARSLELEPGSPDGLTLLGEISRADGEWQEAAMLAQQALEADPEHVDALVLLGTCELQAGRTAQAREHAVWALRLDADDAGARTLLCSIKARSNPLMGLWWRFQSMITSGGTTRAIMLLVGMYLVYRASLIMLADQGETRLTTLLSYLWLGFCMYTWVAPGMFARSLAKEMEEVRLRREF